MNMALANAWAWWDWERSERPVTLGRARASWAGRWLLGPRGRKEAGLGCEGKGWAAGNEEERGLG